MQAPCDIFPNFFEIAAPARSYLSLKGTIFRSVVCGGGERPAATAIARLAAGEVIPAACRNPIVSLFWRRPVAYRQREGNVITIIDVKAELAKLSLLRGRTPQMTETERRGTGAFATLAPFRDGNIFCAKFAGAGAWERHPNGDELVQIVAGATTLHFMTAEGLQSFALGAGMIVIVPQGTWHRFVSPDGVTLMTATPKPTEHLTVDVEDPRTLTGEQLEGSIEEKWR
jgi:mannose-6-phosphate isomerase-like protein (cupin superfamily)